MAEGMKWGDIRLIEFGGRQRSRPALVLTRDAIIGVLTSITVAPITRAIREIPTEIRLGEANGLREPSVATLDNLQTIRKSSVGRSVGSLERGRARELREALLFALGLDRA